MDALEVIKGKMTDEQVINLLGTLGFENVTQNGNNIRAKCHIHGGDNPTSFVYTLSNHMWCCHKCKEGGDIVHIVQLLKQYNFTSAVKYLLNFLGISDDGLNIIERKTQYMKELQAFMRYANAHVTTLDAYTIPKEGKQVKGFRGYNISTLEHFALQYHDTFPIIKADGTQSLLNNRLGMPIYFKQKTVGYALRRVNEADIPKWLFQPPGLNKKNLLYNYKNNWFDEVVVCEGMFDVWAWHEAGIYAVAVLGSSISDEQINLLSNITTKLILSFDGDVAGKIATQKAIDKLKFKFDLRVVCFDEGKDPCDYDTQGLLKVYDEKVHYVCYKI